MSASEDNDDLEEYRKRVDTVSRLFRRKPHNMIEEIEKLGFDYRIDDNADADEIDEEVSAQPISAEQKALVSFLEDGSALPDNHWLTLWRAEIERNNTLCPLWRRYFRLGNGQLKKLLLHGLDQCPTNPDLLAQLAFLHEYLSMPKELMARYMRACNEENDPQRFMVLAQKFDEAAESFGFDALTALLGEYKTDPGKAAVISELLSQRTESQNGGISF